jgi:hypothetical protein
MKIIITESQLNLLIEASSLVDDTDFRETIKSYENEVVDPSGNHYVFDDKDPKNPKTFVNSTNKKRGGTLTIGWGHTGPEAKIGNKISKTKAEQLLTSDIQKEENKAEKKDWKQNNPTGNLTFNEQKEYQKIEKEIKDLESQKVAIEQLFSDGKVADSDIEKKAKDLEEIIQKIETKEERWFELSAKIE